LIVAERIRTRVANTPIPWAEGSISITCSIGVAGGVLRSDAADLPSVDTLVGKADELLYTAKERGRNRIESAPL
jgi:diguanylate cyclase (GGDEF)-like protein